MSIIEKFVDCMKRGDNVALADLFDDYGIFHDSSLIKLGEDTVHLEGKMAVEMMFHNKFGVNGGPFKITSVKITSDHSAYYFIQYKKGTIAVSAHISELCPDGKIKRINIYPL